MVGFTRKNIQFLQKTSPYNSLICSFWVIMGVFWWWKKLSLWLILTHSSNWWLSCIAHVRWLIMSGSQFIFHVLLSPLGGSYLLPLGMHVRQPILSCQVADWVADRLGWPKNHNYGYNFLAFGHIEMSLVSFWLFWSRQSFWYKLQVCMTIARLFFMIYWQPISIGQCWAANLQLGGQF